MELTFAQQSSAFLYSLVLGAAAGLLYDIFYIVRMCFCKGKISAFLIDFIYVTVVSLAMFVFSVAYMRGYVRLFVISGVLLGFSVFRLTIGKLFSKFYCSAIFFARKIIANFSGKIKKILKKLLKNSNKILYNVNKNKGIFRNNDNKSVEKADNFDYEKKHKGKNRKFRSFSADR